MSALALVPRPHTGPAPPAEPGDVVRLRETLYLPSGRRLRRAPYEVLDVVWCDDRRAWRLVVEARPDCSQLGQRFQPPTRQEQAEAARHGVELRVPLAAERTRFYLDAGAYVRYADDNGEVLRRPLDIPDHPLQND